MIFFCPGATKHNETHKPHINPPPHIYVQSLWYRVGLTKTEVEKQKDRSINFCVYNCILWPFALVFLTQNPLMKSTPMLFYGCVSVKMKQTSCQVNFWLLEQNRWLSLTGQGPNHSDWYRLRLWQLCPSHYSTAANHVLITIPRSIKCTFCAPTNRLSSLRLACSFLCFWLEMKMEKI